MGHRFPQSGRSREREKAFCAGGGAVRRMMVDLDSKPDGYDLGSLGRGHGEGASLPHLLASTTVSALV